MSVNVRETRSFVHRWLAVLILATGALTFGLTSDRRQVIADLQSTRNSLAVDTFCTSESCPGQVLFKLNKCPPQLSLKNLEDQFSASASSFTGLPQTFEIKSVTNDCIFVAKTPNKSVNDVMQIFGVIFQNQLKSNATRTDLDPPALVDFEPNFQMQVDDFIPTAVSRINQVDFWWFSSTEPGTDALSAWKKFGDGSREVVVGVLDTGISRKNTALSKNIWEADKAFDVSFGRDSIHCEKGAIGFDTVNNSRNRCFPVDDNGHGTHVAGIISSSGVPRIGVNREVRLMPLKIADAHGATWVSNVLQAIDFVIQVKEKLGTRIRVLNNSYYVLAEANDLTMLHDHIVAADKNSMLFVASAGQTNSSVPQYGNNDEYAHYPSNFNGLPNVISVTAISQKGTLSESSLQTANYGKKSVDLGAPGSSIVSTYLPTISTYSAKTGTSMAAPFVSGTAALLFSVPGCSSLTPNAAKARIIEGTVYTAGLAGKTATDGRLNIYNAISPCARISRNRGRAGRSLNH